MGPLAEGSQPRKRRRSYDVDQSLDLDSYSDFLRSRIDRVESQDTAATDVQLQILPDAPAQIQSTAVQLQTVGSAPSLDLQNELINSRSEVTVPS
jgi:hypothetical protein